MKVVLPGQNEPISIGGSAMSPTWYEKLKFLEKLQPLSDINNSAITAAIATKSNITRTINAQSGTTYTLALTDAGNICEFTNASAVTVTVPPNSSVAFPIGTQVDVMAGGAGKVTFAQGLGVTIKSVNSNKALSAQEAAATLVKMATDTWRLAGSIAP